MVFFLLEGFAYCHLVKMARMGYSKNLSYIDAESGLDQSTSCERNDQRFMHERKGSTSTLLDIERKILQAQDFYTSLNGTLTGDPAIHFLLERLQESIGATRNAMFELGVVAQCRHCEEEEGGSCCGSGIEERYDEVLLLINLLLGVSLPTEKKSENSCYFLGENGCTLLARHVLCVNYLCAKLRKALPHEALMVMQDLAGEELSAEFILHEAIKKHIHR